MSEYWFDYYFSLLVNLGNTTVEIKGNQSCADSADLANTVQRCYVVTPENNHPADITFYYLQNENNNNSDPDLYLHAEGVWSKQDNSLTYGSNSESIWLSTTNLDSFGLFSLSYDQDGDNTPNNWEIFYNLNPQNANDATDDPDNDGLSNYEEYQQQTYPNNDDTDNDGMKDGDEVAIGRDPTDASDGNNNYIMPPIIFLLD